MDVHALVQLITSHAVAQFLPCRDFYKFLFTCTAFYDKLEGTVDNDELDSVPHNCQ